MKEGLIPSRYECQKCKKGMRLVERKGTIDGFELRCRVQSKENPHFVCRSFQNLNRGHSNAECRLKCPLLGSLSVTNWETRKTHVVQYFASSA
ncbi:hypothetical protein TNCV_4743301 [Trichonephila clavipes]|nr:hypothetical protein TNCV_4743301 [Trichonephila clavipes]